MISQKCVNIFHQYLLIYLERK